AARFGLAMLDRAWPDQAPFTPENTRIIATGLSNGGGAVLQAAGLDDAGLLDAVVAIEPNINVPGHGRTLFDYATQAAMLMPCALLDSRFDNAPLARVAGLPPPAWPLRCASLREDGTLNANTLPAQAAEALQLLHADGWRDDAIATAATTTLFDIWRAAAAGYASAYLRRGVGHMPCGFEYRAMNAAGVPVVADAATRASWWADAAGIPPGAGVGLFGGLDASVDPTLSGVRCLRRLWEGDDGDARALHAEVARLDAKMPRVNLPIWVVHGGADGLIPTAFSSEPYIAWLREQGRTPRYWKVPYAQHFDAFLALPGFGDAHVPLMPFGYAALDHVAEHLFSGKPLADPPTPQTQPRGTAGLDAQKLGLKQIPR
ncbi:MAG TPA: 3-hydroxybutyrate oligomer hydrolase family protein, partial [Rudaea sp.]|nr:3-hydroxybutyrate oligomer hydrolase family protein [Rudaea sp.]